MRWTLLGVMVVACSPAPVTTDGGGIDAGSDVVTTGDAETTCDKTCGAAGDQPCCSVAAVSAGSFIRDYDGVTDAGTKQFIDDTHTATLSAFKLDVYAVTIGRFRKFLAAYPGNLPHDGDGKNPNNPNDPGWSSTWNALMPATSAALDAALYTTQNTCATNWHKGVDKGFEQYPMTCATWYEAYAFCIWDGGRLPTSAEYNYAESGGNEQRYYPWSNPPGSTTIDSTLDVYDLTAETFVGSVPAGNGKFGQADLAGNVNQWVLDTNAATDSEIPGLPATCTDCALFDAGPNRVIRGANYLDGVLIVRSVLNQSYPPDTRGFLQGFRCARN